MGVEFGSTCWTPRPSKNKLGRSNNSRHKAIYQNTCIIELHNLTDFTENERNIRDTQAI